ncbi:MAG: CCA tRNA nucleotidyltransferase [Tepidisphaeraceae bacterium]
MNQNAPRSSFKPGCTRNDALAVVKALRAAGHVAYFAGGCVRDELLGLVPADYDVATDAPPDRVRQVFPKTQAVGAAFGVILVHQNKSVVEVATFRADVSYEDGRRPTEVRFTTAEEDAKRRDFTINGLFLDPIQNKVIDFVGGREDLENKLLRAIGEPDHRFDEDHLRMLRAVRFAARFDLNIDQRTHDAIHRHVAQLPRISPERVAEELRLTLTPPSRVAAWGLLKHFHLIDVVFRALQHRDGPAEGHGTAAIFAQTAPGHSISFSLSLASASAAYLWPLADSGDIVELFSRESARRIAAALRRTLHLSNDELEGIVGTMTGVGILLRDGSQPVSVLKRFLARPTAGDSKELLQALAATGFHCETIKRVRDQLAMLEKTDFAPPPLVTGDDLVARGFAPGPVFKKILDAVYDEQLEGRIGTRDEAMALAVKISAAPPSNG